ncbi:MAG: hypothetical protein J7M05_01735 [Anaerolineae bacterium]|nr:hypothetical protein [Anaerolineae bacterium]
MSIFRKWPKRRSLLDAPLHYHSIITWEQGHVRASVIKMNKGAAELIGVASSPIHGITCTSHPDIERWTKGCNQALLQAEDMTPTTHGHKIVPDYVIMGVPSGLARDVALTVSKHRRHANKEISKDELAQLAKRGYRQVQDRMGTRTKGAGEDIIYGSLANIVLDGHSVLDPLGLHGEQIELHLNFTLIPVEWIRALELIAENLRLYLVAIVPHHVACASATPDPRALLIVLYEDYTVAALIRYGKPEWAGTINIGEREMTMATTQVLNLRGHRADMLMRAYREGRLREDIEEKLAIAFWAALRRWMTTLANEIKTAPSQEEPPSRIYFCDTTRRLPEARLSLCTPFWEHCLSFQGCPEVIELSISHVHSVLDCTTLAGDAPYLLLRTLAHHTAQLYAPRNYLDRLLLNTVRWKKVPTLPF